MKSDQSQNVSTNDSRKFHFTIKLRTKIYGGFVIIVLLLAGAVFITLTSINSLKTNLQMTYDHPLVVTRASSLIQFEIVEMHRSMKDVTLSEDPSTRDRYIELVNEEEKETLQLFDTIHKQILGDEGRTLVSNAHEAFLKWRPIRKEVIKLSEKGEFKKAQLLTQNKGATYVDFLILEVEKLAAYAGDKAMMFNTNSSKIVENTRYIAIVTMIICLLFGLSLTTYFTQDIINV